MFNLDPGKLIVIGVVAIILLGPDKLPQFARQVGGAWRTFNEFRHRMESEVRSSMPDLPPTSEIARLARSPSALLNHLSSMSTDEETKDGEAPDGSFQPPGANGTVESGTPGVTGEATAGVAGESAGEWAGDQVEGAASGDGTSAADTAVPGSAPTGGPEPAGPATNGRAVAPQPTEVAIPADPTLN
ncbi:MAG TPA: twin-arginine translocase TatA/TatE family subunit [Acidimicrobiales bacterium]|nr:twin-arginine translocase TatA/TatE family subunit [Acidimicrobiales bacterium]